MTHQPITIWEYKRVYYSPEGRGMLDERDMNEMGDDGWEVIAIERTQGMGCHYVTYKRPKPNDQIVDRVAKSMEDEI